MSTPSTRWLNHLAGEVEYLAEAEFSCEIRFRNAFADPAAVFAGGPTAEGDDALPALGDDVPAAHDFDGRWLAVDGSSVHTSLQAVVRGALAEYPETHDREDASRIVDGLVQRLGPLGGVRAQEAATASGRAFRAAGSRGVVSAWAYRS